MNANVDLIVLAIGVFKQLGIKSQSPGKDHNVIDSLDELSQCFSHHFSKCAAAERFIASKEVYDKIVQVSKSYTGSRVC